MGADDLKGKIALVTGASRGIGKAIAEQLQSLGATVIGTATSEHGASKIAEYLANNDNAGMGLVLNVTSDESIAAMFDAIKENLNPRIEVVELDANINDAAFSETAVDMLLALMPPGRA